MPRIGEIRKGRDIGKTSYAAGANFIWRSCIDCGKEEWVAARMGKPTRLRCRACRGKQIWVTRHTKEDPKPKGTILNPCIGDIRRADEIGFKSNRPCQWCIFVRCPSCEKTRWMLKSNYATSVKRGSNGRCLDCSGKLTGESTQGWRGGIIRDRNGYRMVMVRPDSPYYPMAKDNSKLKSGGYVYEHRLVMAQHLGRCLEPWEVVHHKNHIKDDNRIENLVLATRSQHESITLLENKVRNLESQVSKLQRRAEKESIFARLLLWHILQINAKESEGVK